MEATVTSASSRHPGASVLLRACDDRLGGWRGHDVSVLGWSDAFMLVPGGLWAAGGEGGRAGPVSPFFSISHKSISENEIK